MSIDPLTAKYPHNSPYAFSENRVIDGIELEGLEVILVGNQMSGGLGVGMTGENGFAISPDGLYGYRSQGPTISTSAGITDQISVTIFPDMPSAKFASGTGYSGGVGFSSGIVTGSVNAAYSSGYWGVNFTLGAGPSVGVLGPVTIGGSATETKLSPISESAQWNDASFLKDVSSTLSVHKDNLSDELKKIRGRLNACEGLISKKDKKINEPTNPWREKATADAIWSGQADEYKKQITSIEAEIKTIDMGLNKINERIKVLEPNRE